MSESSDDIALWPKSLSGSPITVRNVRKNSLPDWVHSKADSLVRLQYDAITTGRIPLELPPDGELDYDGNGEPMPRQTTQVVSADVRMKCLQHMLDRLYGKAASVDDEKPGGLEIQRLLAALVTSKEVPQILEVQPVGEK